MPSKKPQANQTKHSGGEKQMLMYQSLRTAKVGSIPESERGAGVVEWLAISALSVGLIVGINTAFDGIITQLISRIQGLLGL